MAANRSAVTRRFYIWEDENVPRGPEAPIAVLRTLGQRIWRENTRRRDRCPQIVAGAGYWAGDRFQSYCEGRSRIVLARNHRNRAILIHEMTHALGPGTHGPRFQALFLSLILRYLI